MSSNGQDPLAAQLDEAVALFKSSRTNKLLRHPRMIPSKVAEQFCRRAGRVMHWRATTFWGDSMTVVLPELVSATLTRYGFYQENVSRMLLQRLGPGKVFMDIGGQLGFFTLLASRIVGPTGEVHVFEPTRSTFPLLERNVAGRENVRANNLAAWSESGTISFNDYGAHMASMNSVYEPRIPGIVTGSYARDKYEVEAVTIDEYCRSHSMPDLVKVDAESAEFEILLGMEEVLRKKRPALALEVGDVGLDDVVKTDQLIDHVEARGYDTLEFDGRDYVKHRRRERYTPSDLFFIPR